MGLWVLFFAISAASAAPSGAGCAVWLESPEQLRAQVAGQLEKHLARLRANPRLTQAARLTEALRQKILGGEIEVEPGLETSNGLEFKVRHYMIEDRLEPRIEALRISTARLKELPLEDWVTAAADVFPEIEYLAGRVHLSSLNYWDSHGVRVRWLEALRGEPVGYGEREYAQAVLASLEKVAEKTLPGELTRWFGLAAYTRLSADFAKLDSLLAEPASATRTADLARLMSDGKFRQAFLELGRAATKAYLAQQLIDEPALGVLSGIPEARARKLIALTRAGLLRQLETLRKAAAPRAE